MAKHRSTPEGWQARLGTTNFDPLTVMDLQDAVRARKKTVILQGRKFLLKYDKKNKTVYYSPEEGFAPAGYLEIERLLED